MYLNTHCNKCDVDMMGSYPVEYMSPRDYKYRVEDENWAWYDINFCHLCEPEKMKTIEDLRFGKNLQTV